MLGEEAEQAMHQEYMRAIEFNVSKAPEVNIDEDEYTEVPRLPRSSSKQSNEDRSSVNSNRGSHQSSTSNQNQSSSSSEAPGSRRDILIGYDHTADYAMTELLPNAGTCIFIGGAK